MNADAERNRRRSEPELLVLLLFLVICLAIGLLTVRQYGVSWDEPSIQGYADRELNAYRYFFHPAAQPPYNDILNFYGPAYFMAADLAARAMVLVVPALAPADAWHFFYFLTFLAGVVLLYLFSRRWLSASASLGMCLLFASQPLFWGHAFINPKDMPFMACFLGSVHVGMNAVDRYAESRPGRLLLAGAAVLLGLTTAFRLVGPLAGALVAVYALGRLGRKSLALLLPYAGIALLVTYVSWPYLWGAPIARFFESLRMMSRFPFPRKLLFMGDYYAGDRLPWFFYPVMLGIQLTLPLLALAVAGLGVAAYRFLRAGGRERQPLLLFAGWFLLPALVIIAGGSTLYDNGRQLFFLLPPVLLLAGLSLDELMKRLRSRYLAAGLVLLLMVPGLYGMVRLHPYEYIYYNQLVGGTGGAYGKYEMDYWGTSSREAAQWLNDHAAHAATLWANPSFLLQEYLRRDLTVACAEETDCGMHYDYVVTLARWNAERQCARAETAYTVQRRGALLLVVKQLKPGNTCR